MRILSADIHLSSNGDSIRSISYTPNPAVQRETNGAGELLLYGRPFGQSPQTMFKDPDALKGSYGVYAYIYQSQTSREVLVGTDPMGFTPLYYAIEESTVKVSTSIAELKQRLCNASIDRESWQELYVLGEAIGSKTPIREVTRLPWGCRLKICSGKMELESVWQPPAAQVNGAEEYLGNSNQLLIEALNKTNDSVQPRVVLLSGGEDSRRIAGAIEHTHLEHTYATQQAIHVGDRDDDAMIAGKIAALLGRPHIVSEMPPPVLALHDELMREQWLGFETVQHGWIMPLLRKLPRGSMIYDGLAGGILNGHFVRRLPEAYRRFHDTEYLADVLIAGNRSPFGWEQGTGPLKTRVIAELERIPASPHRLTWFFLLNHARRNTSLQSHLYGLYDHDWCFPFLYPPLLNLSMTVDPAELGKVSLHKLALRQLCSSLSDLPSTRDHMPDHLVRDMKREQRFRDQAFARVLSEVSWKSLKKLDIPAYRRGLYLTLSKSGLSGYTRRGRWILESAARLERFEYWLADRGTGLFRGEW